MQHFGSTSGQVKEANGAIAAVVHEQAAAPRDIAQSIANAVERVKGMSQSISSVSEAASATGAATDQIKQSAGQLAREAEGLRLAVDRFLTKVRAA